MLIYNATFHFFCEPVKFPEIKFCTTVCSGPVLVAIFATNIDQLQVAKIINAVSRQSKVF